MTIYEQKIFSKERDYLARKSSSQLPFSQNGIPCEIFKMKKPGGDYFFTSWVKAAKIAGVPKNEKVNNLQKGNKISKFWVIQVFKNDIWQHTTIWNHIYERFQELNSSFQKALYQTWDVPGTSLVWYRAFWKFELSSWNRS